MKCIAILLLTALLLCACSGQPVANDEQAEASQPQPAMRDTPSLSASAVPPMTPILKSEPPSAAPSATPSAPPSVPPSAPEPGTYEVRARVEAHMPEYRFVASGEDTFVTGLDVYDEKGESILSVAFEPESRPVYEEMMDTMGLHVVDINFDGYRDVIILNMFAGAHGNSWYDGWLWDARASAFVHSESFVDICNPALDAQKQCVYSTGGEGAYTQNWLIYKYIDGEFVVSNHLSFEWLEDENGKALGIQVTQDVRKDGKMEVVEEVLIPGEATIDETSYFDDELWQLNHPRWYGMGGHQADEWLE